jgi:hypothetical protein
MFRFDSNRIDKTDEEYDNDPILLIYNAIEQGNLEEVKKIINTGFPEFEKEKNKLLYRAAMGGKIPIVDFLIKKGADVNNGNYEGNTLLNHVLSHEIGENFPMAKFLIDNGADINKQNKNGDTPLHFAAHFDNFEEVKFLLSNGANENIKNKYGEKPRVISRSLSSDIDEQIVFNGYMDLRPEHSLSQILLDNYRKMKLAFLSCNSLKCPVFTEIQGEFLKTQIRSRPKIQMVYKEIRSEALMLSSFGMMRGNKFNFLHDEMSRDMLDMFDSESFGDGMELFEEEKDSHFNYSKTDEEAQKYIENLLQENLSSSSSTSNNQPNNMCNVCRSQGTVCPGFTPDDRGGSAQGEVCSKCGHDKTEHINSGGRRKSRKLRKSRKSYNKKGKSGKSRKSRKSRR